MTQTKNPGEHLAAFIAAMRAAGTPDMEIADTLRGAATLVASRAGSLVDLANGRKAYVISLTLDVRAQNQEEAVEKAYEWMRTVNRSLIALEVRRPGTIVTLSDPPASALLDALNPNENPPNGGAPARNEEL